MSSLKFLEELLSCEMSPHINSSGYRHCDMKVPVILCKLIINRWWRSVTFFRGLWLCWGEVKMTFHWRLEFEPPAARGDKWEYLGLEEVLSPGRFCSRTPRLPSELFHGENKVAGRGQNHPTGQGWKHHHTCKCQVSHSGNKYQRCTHLWDTYNIFNYGAKICISLSPAILYYGLQLMRDV